MIQKKVRVLEKTRAYPNNLWVVQPYISKDLRFVLQQAFTSLVPNNDKDKEILDKTGTTFFLPASHEDFTEIEAAIHKLERQGEE